MSKVIPILLGPTATGKTSLAIKIAKRLPVRIISVDSAKIYRGMDIGTAKPSKQILERFPHDLVDICEPTQTYSVGDFYQDIQVSIKKALAEGALPLIVGGSMMYINSLRQGLAPLPPSTDAVRQTVKDELQLRGLDAMYAYLKKVDPTTAKQIPSNDSQRIQRAIEVYKLTGKSLSSHIEAAKQKPSWPFVYFAFFPPRASLHCAIEERLNHMLKQGFVEEVAYLKQLPGMSADLPSMRSVGYRQIWAFLDGHGDEIHMQQKILAATRQVAKRQCTWMRSWSDLHILGHDPLSEILSKVD